MQRLYEIVETQETLRFRRYDLGEGWVHVPANATRTVVSAGSGQQEPSNELLREVKLTQPLPELSPEAGNKRTSDAGRQSSEVPLQAVPETVSVMDNKKRSFEVTYIGTASSLAQAQRESSGGPSSNIVPQVVLQPILETETRDTLSGTRLAAAMAIETHSHGEDSRSPSVILVSRPMSMLDVEVGEMKSHPETKHFDTTVHGLHPRTTRSLKTKLGRMLRGHFRSSPPVSAPVASTEKVAGLHKSRLRQAFKQGMKMVTQTRPKAPKIGHGVLNLRHFVKQAAKMR